MKHLLTIHPGLAAVAICSVMLSMMPCETDWQRSNCTLESWMRYERAIAFTPAWPGAAMGGVAVCVVVLCSSCDRRPSGLRSLPLTPATTRCNGTPWCGRCPPVPPRRRRCPGPTRPGSAKPQRPPLPRIRAATTPAAATVFVPRACRDVTSWLGTAPWRARHRALPCPFPPAPANPPARHAARRLRFSTKRASLTRLVRVRCPSATCTEMSPVGTTTFACASSRRFTRKCSSDYTPLAAARAVLAIPGDNV